MNENLNFYRENDPRDVPHYGITEATRIIPGVPKSTLRNWFNGSDPILNPSDVKPITLSFNNLVEACVLQCIKSNSWPSIAGRS